MNGHQRIGLGLLGNLLQAGPPPSLIPPPPPGPGTKLKAQLAALGIATAAGCPCDDVARWMDYLGVEGCKRERAALLEYLRGQQGKLGWGRTLWAWFEGLKAVATGAIPLAAAADPVAALLDEAIRQAEADNRT